MLNVKFRSKLMQFSGILTTTTPVVLTYRGA